MAWEGHGPGRSALVLDLNTQVQPSAEDFLINLSFPSMEGRSYTIEESSDLIRWEVLESGIPGAGLVERAYPATGRRERFFRVREEHQ